MWPGSNQWSVLKWQPFRQSLPGHELTVTGRYLEKGQYFKDFKMADLLSFENPVFSHFAFYVAVLAMKMAATALYTALLRAVHMVSFLYFGEVFSSLP